MKRLSLLLIILLPSIIHGQQTNKAQITNADNDVEVQRVLVTDGKTISDFIPLNPRETNNTRMPFSELIETGNAPEGDYMGMAIFSNDGNRVFVSNRITNNVTVYDWATQTVITNIDVGENPFDMNVTDDYLVVACHFSDEVYIIDLDNYLTLAIIETDEQPVAVRVSPDQKTAFVACDINDKCEVIDLITLTSTQTISNFPMTLANFSGVTGNNRNSYEYADFKVSPDGTDLIIGDADDQLLFFDVETGNINSTIDGVKANKMAFSGDSTSFFALYPFENTVYKIDVATSTVVDSFDLGSGYVSRRAICVNQGGSKVYVPIDGNESAILNFETDLMTTYSITYSAFWVGVSPDHSTIISGQNNFTLIDFETEAVLDQYIGNIQSQGAASPVGFNIVGFDPLRNEALFFYDYTNPSNLQYLGEFVSGKAPESDAPYRVAITPDGTKAVVTTTLSGNVTLVDLLENVVDTIIELGEKSEAIAITADSKWAILGGWDDGTIKFINLITSEYAASVYTGSRPGLIRISPDQQFAYVANISANTISVIALDGENSYKITDIPCGVIGVIWGAYGVRSDVQVSPTGEYVLVAASFDDNVKVIDTQTNSIVATLPVGDFPIQIAFNNTGEYAVVSNRNDHTYSVIHVDGSGSSVEGTYAPTGNAPLRMAYDFANDQVALLSNSDHVVDLINPETGEIEDTEDYSAYGSLYQIMVSSLGEKFILTGAANDESGYFITPDSTFILPAPPSFFDYSEANNLAAIVAPGPDYLTIINWNDTLTSVENIPLTANLTDDLIIYPNPGTGFFKMNCNTGNLTISNTSGKMILSKKLFNDETVIDLSNQPNGLYTVTVKTDDKNRTGRILLQK